MEARTAMASTTALGNWAFCFMSAWMVGKVEAPANANIIELKATAMLIEIEDHPTCYKWG